MAVRVADARQGNSFAARERGKPSGGGRTKGGGESGLG